MINTSVNLDELKNEYRSLAKKSQYAREYLRKNAHIREPKKRAGRGLGDDDAIGILNQGRGKRGGGGDSLTKLFDFYQNYLFEKMSTKYFDQTC